MRTGLDQERGAGDTDEEEEPRDILDRVSRSSSVRFLDTILA